MDRFADKRATMATGMAAYQHNRHILQSKTSGDKITKSPRDNEASSPRNNSHRVDSYPVTMAEWLTAIPLEKYLIG